MNNSVIYDDAAESIESFADIIAHFSGAKILVVGGGGFLGGYLIELFNEMNSEKMLEQPIEIVAIDKPTSHLGDRLSNFKNSPYIKIYPHDITEEISMSDSFQWIIHAASIASPSFYRKFPLQTIDVNVNGTRNLLEFARKQKSLKGFLFLSSSEVYGDPDPQHIPTAENYVGQVSFTGPRACYDESKRLGETLCVNYVQEFGIPVKIVRPFNIYGPGQNLKDKRLIPDLISRILIGKSPKLYSDGLATRSFCYVRDFIQGMLRVLVQGGNGEAYNIGNEEEISIKELANLLIKVSNNPSLKVEFETSLDPNYLTDNPKRRCPNLTKAKNIGYNCMVSTFEGLTRTYKSYQE